MQNYPWFKVIDAAETITQGDIYLKCIVPILQDKTEAPYFEVKGTIIDCIVLTQACDLENTRPKVNKITVCEIKPLSEVVKKLMEEEYKDKQDYNYAKLNAKEKKKKQSIIDKLRKGEFLDFYVLNKFEYSTNLELNQDYRVVLLRNSYHLPLNALNQHIINTGKSRLRLSPPYREHLSNAFAFNFSRIGLPIDLSIKEGDI